MGFFFNRSKSTRAVRTDISLLCADFGKVVKVIDSCERPVHYDVATRHLDNLVKKWGLVEADAIILNAVQHLINSRRTVLQNNDVKTANDMPTELVAFANPEYSKMIELMRQS